MRHSSDQPLLVFHLVCGWRPERGWGLPWLPAFALEGPGERKWHERLIVLRPSPSNDPRTVGWCVTATPDGDVYGEPVAPPNVAAFAVLGQERALPPGLRRRNVYRFEDGAIGQAPSAAELAHLRGLAQAELDALQAEIDSTGAGVLVPAVPAAPAAASAAAMATGPVLTACYCGLSLGSRGRGGGCEGKLGSNGAGCCWSPGGL